MNVIKFDKRNYRKHNDKNKKLIKKSLQECGAGRSIIIDNEGEIIAGNGVYEQAQKLGLKTKIVETDGSELVVVKRTDLATDDEKRKRLAVMDNSTSDTSEFDIDLLEEDFAIDDLNDMGLDLKIEEDEDEEKYSIEIKPPIYEPKCKNRPSLEECIDTSKYNQLISEINNTNGLSEEEKRMLIFAAMRHISFNYQKIAEYYCHCNAPVQRLMENSALVIIDINRAIELGFVNLTEEIIDILDKNE